MRKSIFLFSFIFLFFFACSTAAPPKWEQSYQKNADKIRIRDVHHLATLIENYYRNVGHYPLVTGGRARVDVLITNKSIDYPVPTIPISEFEKVMKDEFGEGLKIPMDPQKVDVWGGPRFYAYVATKDNYWVSAYLFSGTSMTRKIAEYSYKYEVGSVAIPEKNIHRFRPLDVTSTYWTAQKVRKFMTNTERSFKLQKTIKRIENSEIDSRKLQIVYLILRNTPEHYIHNLNGVTGNKVYIHKDGHRECVYDKDGNLVKDGINDGSYNHFDRRKHPLNHFSFDTHPWIIWGNSRKDTTSKEERIYGYICDLESGIRKALDEKESLKEIKKENWNRDGQLQALAIFTLVQEVTKTASLFSLFEKDISSITDQDIFDVLRNLEIGFNKIY